MDSEENIDTMQHLNSFKECIGRYFGEKEFPITERTEQDCGDEWVLGSSYKDQQLDRRPYSTCTYIPSPQKIET